MTYIEKLEKLLKLRKELTGYPSIDKTHLKGSKFYERHPFIPSMSFSEVMDLMFGLQGNHNIVDCLNLRVTSEEFKKDSIIYAKALKELGVKEGDIIVASMPSYYQTIPIFKATNSIGAITTYLNEKMSIEDTIYFLNLYNSKIFFYCDNNPYIINKIKANTNVEHIIIMDEKLVNSRDFNQKGNYDVGNKDDISLHELETLSKFQKGKVGKHFGGQQDALILYTSGSTGKSKSIVYTNENLVSSCIYLKNSTHVPKPVDGDRRWMAIVPFMYPYGFGASVLQTFLSGREVILTPKISKDNIAEYLKKDPDLIFGSPANLELIRRFLPKEQKISNLKIYLSGGDFLSTQASLDAIDFFSQHGANVKMCNSSGTGETMGCSTNAMNIPYRPETVGQLVIGPKCMVIDESGIDPVTHKVQEVKEVKYGEVGVLCTTGKHVFKEYYKRPDLTDEVKFNYNGEEWYCSGNIGFLDEYNYFTLIGRSSRFFIPSNSNKVYCEKVQKVVSSIDCIDSCAIVPKPNSETLFESKAFVVLKEGYEPSNDLEYYIMEQSRNITLKDELGEQITLTDYEEPKSVTFLDILPRTESAEKINYELLKQMAEEEYNKEINENKQLIKKN